MSADEPVHVCDVAGCEQGFPTMAEVIAHERTHRSPSGEQVTPERTELHRMAGKMLGSIDYLRAVVRVRSAEGSSYTRLASALADLVWTRERIIAIAEALPEGPLEAFCREHPLYDDPIDGPFCGYGHQHGDPYKCPVHDLALHWDAWEMMGTRHKRPSSARRQGSQSDGRPENGV